jgi:Gpi18-like mannosyltransferase
MNPPKLIDVRIRYSQAKSRAKMIWLHYRGVLVIFIFSQIVFILSVWIGARTIPPAYPAVTNDDQEFGLFVSSHFRWDALNYLTIAMDGYHVPVDQGNGKLPAFFPLYPLIIRLVANFLGLSSVLAYAWVMIVLNMIFSLGAFICIYNLAEMAGLDSTTFFQAILYQAIFPLAVFLIIPYTEALFLFLSALFFLLIFSRKWISAGVIAGLLSATRIPGLIFSFLLILKFILYVKKNGVSKKEGFHGIIAGAFSVSGLALYILYLQVTFSDPLAFIHAQSYWKRDLLFPFVTLWRGVVYALFPSRSPFMDEYLINTVHTILVVLFVVVMIASFRRWNWLYQVYAWLLFSISLISPLQGSSTMSGTARYMMVLFPVYFSVASWAKAAWQRMLIFAIWLFLFSLMAALLGRGWQVG